MSDVTDWIGAISGAVGAVGASGALLIGAITLRKQIFDTHRAQAMAVTLTVTTDPPVDGEPGPKTLEIRNDSSLPIYQVFLGYYFPSAREEVFYQLVLPAHERMVCKVPDTGGRLVARFRDAAGSGWTRYTYGELSPRYAEPEIKGRYEFRSD
ncbi:hypothetical protein QFZ36_000537 [Pseudarthrobacter siccitolerans]|uniref:Uncharacterized protein n=1 Tax=Pseudarthrobacter siccitolerans TaxID=861266 RepID=A0ABU0PG83_9MICC|nr:hypothetical protein [Pseudarthrobacter siccitolerans]